MDARDYDIYLTDIKAHGRHQHVGATLRAPLTVMEYFLWKICLKFGDLKILVKLQFLLYFLFKKNKI